MSELHPVLDPAERRRLILVGVELFNSGRFYDCHEAWETVWRSTTPEPRDLFQGLIQVGVGFYHWRTRDRPDVARRVLGKGRRRLAPLGDLCLGFDLADLLRQVDRWRDWLGSERAPRERPSPPVLRIVAPGAVG